MRVKLTKLLTNGQMKTKASHGNLGEDGRQKEVERREKIRQEVEARAQIRSTERCIPIKLLVSTFDNSNSN